MNGAQKSFLIPAGAGVVAGCLGMCLVFAFFATTVVLWQQGTWLPVGSWLGGLTLLATLFYRGLLPAYWNYPCFAAERAKIDSSAAADLKADTAAVMVALVSIATVIVIVATAEKLYWSEKKVVPAESIGEHHENWRVVSVTDKGAGIYVLTLENPESSSSYGKISWRIDEKTYKRIQDYAGSDTAVGVILKRVE